MKVLIFNKNLTPKNIGGPCGYMYNIEEFMKKNPSDTITFYPSGFVSYFIQRLKRKIEREILKRKNLFCHVFLSYFYTIPFAKEEIAFINTFDYVHIHSVSYYLKYFYKNKKITAKTILTTHSPEPFVDEFFNDMGYGEWLKKHPTVRNMLIKREIRAYQDCYKIMFPVKEAREPYEKASPLYKKCFEEVEDKFFYVPTAVNDVEKIDTNNHILDKYALPEKALRVCYIGRHTSVKGYDSLQSMAQEAWKSMPGIYFIIGGKEAPLLGLNDKRWIELGWVNTPALLNEVDVFVLPNRDTYFDLILLEVLRQGTPVILSRTGGNRWFEDKGLKGLMFYDYGDSLEFSRHLQTVNDIKLNGKLEDIKKETVEYFKSEFNMGNYMQRYVLQLEKFKQISESNPPGI